MLTNGAANQTLPMLLRSLPETSSPAEFSARLLHFINHDLPRLDRRGREWPPVLAGTPLFTGGLLDSLSILHLIAATEGLTAQAVPHELVVLKHFQSVASMTSGLG